MVDAGCMGNAEVCGDQVDDNCNGMSDDGRPCRAAPRPCYPGGLTSPTLRFTWGRRWRLRGRRAGLCRQTSWRGLRERARAHSSSSATARHRLRRAARPTELPVSDGGPASRGAPSSSASAPVVRACGTARWRQACSASARCCPQSVRAATASTTTATDRSTRTSRRRRAGPGVCVSASGCAPTGRRWPATMRRTLRAGTQSTRSAATASNNELRRPGRRRLHLHRRQLGLVLDRLECGASLPTEASVSASAGAACRRAPRWSTGAPASARVVAEHDGLDRELHQHHGRL